MARNAVSSPRASIRANPLRAASLLLLGFATLVAVWLAYQSMQSGPVPGCDDGGCAAVLSSKWSKLFGVPVGLFGAATYVVLAILGAQPFRQSRQLRPRIAAAALVLLIPAAAVWFAALQVFVLKAFCRWCSATHAIATLGAILMILAWRRDHALHSHAPASPGRKGHPHPHPRSAFPGAIWGPAITAAALALVGFAFAQILSPEPPKPRVITASMGSSAAQPAVPGASNSPGVSTSSAVPSVAVATNTVVPPPLPPAVASVASPAPPTPAGPKRLDLHAGRFVLDPQTLPCVGSPEARHLMVMISDYTCIHCRRANRIMHEIRESFGPDQLGTVMLPTQHGGESLELQRLMLAAWKVDPAAWADVATEIYEERLQSKPAVVKPVLEQRLGADRLAASVQATEAWATNLLTVTKDILVANKEKTKSGSIPQFVMGTEIVVGEPRDAAEVYELLEKNLGLVRERFPDLHLASGEIDLGRVFAGTSHTISVDYTNTGQAALTLSRANPPVGGRVIRGLQTPVAPGATSMVQFTVAAPRDAGPFEQTLMLFSNARPPQTPVRIRGTVWKPVEISPTLLDFGRLDPTATTTQGVITIQLKEPARLASVRSQNPGFEASLREVEAGKAYEINVATTPNLAPGVQQGTLLITIDKPVPPGWPDNLAVGTRAVVERAVTAMPPRLVLPAGALPNERYHQVLVRCTDGTPDFKVTSVVLEGGPAANQPDVQPVGSGRDVMIRLTLPAGWSIPLPPVTARLVIKTSHPRYPVIEVPLISQGA